MHRLMILPALLLTLAIAACASIPNPVSGTNIYQAKIVYAGTLELVVKYRDYCWSKPYAALMADTFARPICQNRRAIVRRIQSADNVAYAAITKADTFVANNPTLNATALIGVAWTAVADFQRAVPAIN